MNAKRTQTIGYLANFRAQTYTCLHPPALQDTGRTHAQEHTHKLASHQNMHSHTRTYPVTAMKREKKREDDSLKLCRQQNLSYHITHIQACKASVPLSLSHPANSRANGLKRVLELSAHKSRREIWNKSTAKLKNIYIYTELCEYLDFGQLWI